MSTSSRTYFPAKTFDDDFERLVDLIRTQGWLVPTYGIEQLQQEVSTQRTARREQDALEIRFQGQREAFGLGQEERYAIYASVLNALRGAFRKDKENLAMLQGFTRSMRKRRKAESQEPVVAPVSSPVTPPEV